MRLFKCKHKFSDLAMWYKPIIDDVTINRTKVQLILYCCNCGKEQSMKSVFMGSTLLSTERSEL